MDDTKQQSTDDLRRKHIKKCRSLGLDVYTAFDLWIFFDQLIKDREQAVREEIQGKKEKYTAIFKPYISGQVARKAIPIEWVDEFIGLSKQTNNG